MSELMVTHRELMSDHTEELGQRWGTPIEKGVALNQAYMEEHEKEIQK
jgi:hypothetical protein